MEYNLNNIKRFVRDLKIKSGLDTKNILEYSDLEKLIRDLKGEIVPKKYKKAIDGSIVFKDKECFTIFINENENNKENLAILTGHLFLHTDFFEESPENYEDDCLQRGMSYAREKQEATFFGLELLIDTDYFFKELHKTAIKGKADLNRMESILGISRENIEKKGFFYNFFK